MKELASIAICFVAASFAWADAGHGASCESCRYDLIEINETWFEHSDRPLRQLLVFTWDDDLGRFVLDDFAILDRQTSLRRLPSGEFIVSVVRGLKYVEVVAPIARRTISATDPESCERGKWPGLMRRRLPSVWSTAP
jgi:hypothetical protein